MNKVNLIGFLIFLVICSLLFSRESKKQNPVIDHPDDVFDLIRITDVIGQVVVHLCIGDVTLLLALGDQIF